MPKKNGNNWIAVVSIYDVSDFNLLKLIFILTFRPVNGSKKWLLLEFLKKVSLMKIRKGECGYVCVCVCEI